MSTISFLKIFGVVFSPLLFFVMLYFWDKEAFMRRWNELRGKSKE